MISGVPSDWGQDLPLKKINAEQNSQIHDPWENRPSHFLWIFCPFFHIMLVNHPYILEYLGMKSDLHDVLPGTLNIHLKIVVQLDDSKSLHETWVFHQTSISKRGCLGFQILLISEPARFFEGPLFCWCFLLGFPSSAVALGRDVLAALKTNTHTIHGDERYIYLHEWLIVVGFHIYMVIGPPRPYIL